ncbi:helix-turn-helix domain-containing protein [Streptomyces sp. RPT161]|uniref:helix-turn-helix domain-containing protein n=1 Tax=Streptomyces sp. RPT161 TaxID=3015993 RepID=UPI0022B87D44|nr:helix-turn-helix transcriptional regulator [Streptomyces sp. RPT161]
MDPISRKRHTPPPELGPLLAAARQRSGLGLRETARRAGLNHQYLQRLETGQRVPSMSVAKVLAEVLALDEAERAVLLAAALPDAGRDYPGRRRPGSKIGTRTGAHGHQLATE